MKRIFVLIGLLIIISTACATHKNPPTDANVHSTVSPTGTNTPTLSSTHTPTANPTKTPSLTPTPIDTSLLTSPIIKDAYTFYFENKDELSSELRFNARLYDMMPHKGIYWPFIAYEPPTLRSKNLLVIVPNTGNYNFEDDDNFITQYRAAIGALEFAKRESDEIGAILLVPVFPRFSIPHTFGSQYLSKFTLGTEYVELKDVDKQLLLMADTITSEYKQRDIYLSNRLLLTGYSAQSWFSSRFVALNPSRVQAVAIGGCAWPTVPEVEYDGVALPFPLGLGSLVEYGREIPEISDYEKVSIYFYWGSLDGLRDDGSWDFGPITDGYQQYSYSYRNAWFYEKFGYSAEDLFYSHKEIFESVVDNVQFDLFDGLDHHQVYSKNYSNAIEFLKRNAEYFEE